MSKYLKIIPRVKPVPGFKFKTFISCSSAEVPISRKWVKLPSHQMKQIDTGLTSSLWGISPAGQPQVYLNDSWVRVNKVFKQVSSGEAGVWAIKADGQVSYRAGVSHLNPTGMRWKHVAGHLKQIDSGAKGIVYGINLNNQLVCRGGIQNALPTGLQWKLFEGNYKQVTCGFRGCWAIHTSGMVLFRIGIAARSCKGRTWIPVAPPKKLTYIELGADGILWAVADNGAVWYRDGVDDLHPYGRKWVKLDLGGKFSLVTSGLLGQYALDAAGYVYHLEGRL